MVMMLDLESVGIVGPAGFRDLLEAGGVEEVRVVSAGELGLAIAMKVGENDFVLGRSRGGIRFFQSIDGAASVLIQHNITSFHTDMNGWLPRMLSKSKNRSQN